jgi:ferrous iron transport protein A
MKKTTLVSIASNRKAKVTEVSGGAALQHKLMSMGIYKGREVVKLSHIGLRGPVVIKSGRSILALGHSIAAKIMVELV